MGRFSHDDDPHFAPTRVVFDPKWVAHCDGEIEIPNRRGCQEIEWRYGWEPWKWDRYQTDLFPIAFSGRPFIISCHLCAALRLLSVWGYLNCEAAFCYGGMWKGGLKFEIDLSSSDFSRDCCAKIGKDFAFLRFWFNIQACDRQSQKTMLRWFIFKNKFCPFPSKFI